jgi:hypothetical protein
MKATDSDNDQQDTDPAPTNDDERDTELAPTRTAPEQIANFIVTDAIGVYCPQYGGQ